MQLSQLVLLRISQNHNSAQVAVSFSHVPERVPQKNTWHTHAPLLLPTLRASTSCSGHLGVDSNYTSSQLGRCEALSRLGGSRERHEAKCAPNCRSRMDDGWHRCVWASGHAGRWNVTRSRFLHHLGGYVCRSSGGVWDHQAVPDSRGPCRFMSLDFRGVW